MTDVNQQILNLIMKEETISSIAEQLNLSHKQIWRRLAILRQNGFRINQKYYSNGETAYQLNSSLSEQVKIKNSIALLTSPDVQELEIMIISDPHLGSKYENINALNLLYDYCVQNGIHIILNVGDLINGLGRYSIHKTYEEQVAYAVKNYPFDKSILNFTCLGNHDFEMLKDTGQDLKVILENVRQDIVPLGYGIGFLRIKNDAIMLKHPLFNAENVNINPNENHYLYLVGHSHQMSVKTTTGDIHLYVPTISNQGIDTIHTPMAIQANLKFDKQSGLFCLGIIKHIIITDKPYIINEMYFDLLKGKKIYKDAPIQNEETPKVLVKKIPSQIEKFNQRYKL